MALETGLWRLFWIDDRAFPAARCDMQTPWAVARFAAHIYGFFYGCALCLAAFCAARLYNFALLSLQPRVSGCSEVTHNLFMAGRAFLRANELRSGNAGRR